MPRKPRPLDRDLGVVRDATLVVIASEDTHAVQKYFSKFQPRRVQFKVLPTEDGRSAPQHIVARLNQFRQEFDLDDADQLWYCGDLDHWATENHLPNLVQVLQHCGQSGHRVALSNPCFELWLLLHFTDVPDGLNSCAEISRALSDIAGGYSKHKGCHATLSAEMVMEARRRAAKIDEGTSSIPQTYTTRVYQILESLIERESIVIR